MSKKQKMETLETNNMDASAILKEVTKDDPKHEKYQYQVTGHDLDHSPIHKALSCHLIHRVILGLLNFQGLLSMRAVNRQWYSLANEEIRRRGGLALQFHFDPLENEYEQVPAPVKVKAPTPDGFSSSSSHGGNSEKGQNGEGLNSKSNQNGENQNHPGTKKYLRELAEILGSTLDLNLDLDFPCTHFTFTGGDLKSGRAREFFCSHGEWIDTLILRNVSPSEETLVSLLQCQAPNVVKLSLSLGLNLKESDWVPEERRYLTRDPSRPPELLAFRVNLEPLNLPALEVLHFGEEMQKRDWRRAVAYQLVARSPKLKRLGNFPVFQFNLPFWQEREGERIALFKEFTIYKPQLLFPCPQPPPGMTVPLFREQQRIAAQIRAAMRDRQQNQDENVQIVVRVGVSVGIGNDGRIINQVQTPGQIEIRGMGQRQIPGQGQGQGQAQPQVPGQGLVEPEGANTGRGSNAAFVEGVKAYKDFGKFNREKFKLKKFTFDLSQKLDPSIDTTTIHTTRHLIPDFLRIFETSQESLQILEWEYVDTIPVLPGGYPNVHRLTLQVDTREEQTFKTEVVHDLFPNVKSIGLTYLQTSGLFTLKGWHNYFTPSTQPQPPNDNGNVNGNGPRPQPAVTSLESVEELELSDDFPCTRSWDKFRQLFPNLKRIKSFAAVTTPHHGIFFVYWPQLQFIEWAGRYKLTREDSHRLLCAKEPQLDSRTLETLEELKRERQKKDLWTPEPLIFGGFEANQDSFPETEP